MTVVNAPGKSKCGWSMTRESAAVLLALAMVCGSVPAAQGEASSAAAPSEQAGQSADEIAKELSNPAGSLASLNFNLQYQTFKGDLPDADDQDSWSMIFQPTLPFPVGDQGRTGDLPARRPGALRPTGVRCGQGQIRQCGPRPWRHYIRSGLCRHRNEDQKNRFSLGCRCRRNAAHGDRLRRGRQAVAAGPGAVRWCHPGMGAGRAHWSVINGISAAGTTRATA